MSGEKRDKAVSARWRRAILFGAALGALWCVPLDWVLADRVPLCPFRHLLGWECLGCGMTRAFFSLLHGRWEEALRYNRLCVVAFPVAIGLCVRFIVKAGNKA